MKVKEYNSYFIAVDFDENILYESEVYSLWELTKMIYIIFANYPTCKEVRVANYEGYPMRFPLREEIYVRK